MTGNNGVPQDPATGRLERNYTLTEKDAKVRNLYMQGLTKQEIADQVGYFNHAGVTRSLDRSEKALIGAATEAERAKAIVRYAQALAEAQDIIDNPPLDYGSRGVVVIDPRTGEPQVDKKVVNAAINTKTRLEERLSRLLGLDAPKLSKLEIEGTLNIKQEFIDGALDIYGHRGGENAFYYLMSRLGIDLSQKIPLSGEDNRLRLTPDEHAMLEVAVQAGNAAAVVELAERSRERAHVLGQEAWETVKAMDWPDDVVTPAKPPTIAGVAEEPEPP